MVVMQISGETAGTMKEKNSTDTNIKSRKVVRGKMVSDKAASKDKHTVNSRVGKTSFFF